MEQWSKIAIFTYNEKENAENWCLKMELIRENDGPGHLLLAGMKTDVVTSDDSFTLSCKANIIVKWLRNHPFYLPHRLKCLSLHTHLCMDIALAFIIARSWRTLYIDKRTNKLGYIPTISYYPSIKTNDLP